MSKVVLSGDLQFVRLGALLHLAEAEMLNGRIVCGDRGRVELSGGMPVGARWGGELTGHDAIREMFFCDTGRFSVELVEGKKVDGEPLAPVIALVMDGCRIVDEWERLSPLFLKWDPTWEKTAEGPILALIDKVRGLLEVFDGRRAVGPLVERAGLYRAHVTDPLRILLEEGYLESVDEPADGPAPITRRSVKRPKPGDGPAANDYDGLVAHGRSALRDGDLDAAEASFLAALALRPDDRVVAQNLRHVRLRRSGDWSRSNGWQYVPSRLSSGAAAG